MLVTVSDIISCLNDIAPFSSAESWDNVGLLVGNRSRVVRALLVALDPTNRLLDEARALGADTVVTHHPAIFRPLPAIDTADPTGRFLEQALGHKLNIIACHTNLDSARRGVNDALAELLGLTDLQPLVAPAMQQPDGTGLGRVGRYPDSLTGSDFIARVLNLLELPSCLVAGPLPARINTVALCGGSGAEFAELARQRGADVYLSAEIKHHVARWAEECGFCVIDGTHYATEKPVVPLLARRLREYVAERDWEVAIYETTTERTPFNHIEKTSKNNQNPTGEAS